MNHMWFSGAPRTTVVGAPGRANVESVPAGMDWEALERKALRAPWVPPLADAFDTSHFDTEVCARACVVCVLPSRTVRVSQANDGEDDASLAEPEEDGSWHAAF